MDAQVLGVAWDVASAATSLMDAVTPRKKRLGCLGTVPASMTHEERQSPIKAEQPQKTFAVEITVFLPEDLFLLDDTGLLF